MPLGEGMTIGQYLADIRYLLQLAIAQVTPQDEASMISTQQTFIDITSGLV